MGLARRHLLGDFQNLKKINRRFVCQVARTSRLKKAVINREFVLPIVMTMNGGHARPAHVGKQRLCASSFQCG
jgi:hypothetical protein